MPYYRNRFTTAPRCPAMPGEIRSDAMPSDAQRCQGNERCPAMPGEIRSDARDARDEQTQAMVTDDQLSEELLNTPWRSEVSLTKGEEL